MPKKKDRREYWKTYGKVYRIKNKERIKERTTLFRRKKGIKKREYIGVDRLKFPEKYLFLMGMSRARKRGAIGI